MMKRTKLISIVASLLVIQVIFSPVLSYSYCNSDIMDTDSNQEHNNIRNTRGAPIMNEGIWISQQEIQQLPTSGEAWLALKAQADSDCGIPNVSDQYQDNNVYVLAKALVYARTLNESYRTEVRQQLALAINTELGGRTLALGRELAAYVISADLIDLPNYDQTFDENEFRPWLERCLTENLDGRTLQSTHEYRPNNWGTHAGASRIATAIYLQNATELNEAAQVFQGWLGDRSVYSEFSYGELSWQADSENPVGINPMGSTKDGHSIDGIIPDDMRRGGTFGFPPVLTDYPWEALQGATVQAQLLYRQGYDAWNWSDMAILRSAQFLYDLGENYDSEWLANGDDEWNVWLINYAYKTCFPTELLARFGKNMGWTDWTHANTSVGSPPHSYPPLLLRKGWNLISIPLIQENQSLESVLGNIEGCYNALQYYDPTDMDDPWKHHRIGKPYGNDLFELNEKRGFWIHITQPGYTILICNGIIPTQERTITFKQGWNLAGYPSLTSLYRLEGLNNLDFYTEVNAIFYYSSVTRKFREMGSSDRFDPGRGYYMHTKADCIWEVPLVFEEPI